MVRAPRERRACADWERSLPLKWRAIFELPTFLGAVALAVVVWGRVIRT
jgi:hypothetical protein